LDEAEKYRLDAEQLSESYPGIAPAAATDRESVELTIRNYRVFVETGVVNEVDFALIVETRIHDRELHDVAEDMGLDYAVARKRRYRAEQAIKESFEKYF